MESFLGNAPGASAMGADVRASIDVGDLTESTVVSKGTLEGKWDFRLQYAGSPAMRSNVLDVAHVTWTAMYCCRSVAGLVLEHFHPAQTSLSHPMWGVMQRLLRHCRRAILSDPHRLQAAIELSLSTLPTRPSDLQERWLAAVLTRADHIEKMRWCEHGVPDPVRTQLQRVRQVLRSIPNVRPLPRTDLGRGVAARWLTDTVHNSADNSPTQRASATRCFKIVQKSWSRRLSAPVILIAEMSHGSFGWGSTV